MPRPTIGGGGSGTTDSALDLAELGAEPLDHLGAPSEASLRSSNGFNETTMKAAFDCE